MKTELVTEIEIAAPPARVWTVLADLPAYPDWNPFIRSVTGTLEPATRLIVELQLPGHRPVRIRPSVLAALPQRQLRWMGHWLFPGLFSGEHAFCLEPDTSGGTRFVHRETFTGILVPIVWPLLRTPTRQAFSCMNAALKLRAESTS